MLKLMSLLFLACLANADKVVNINKEVDEGLQRANTFLTSKGLGLHPLPDHVYGDLDLKHGAHVGSNSLQRSADATLTTADDGKVTVDVHVGWHLYASAYGNIKSQGLEFSGGVIVKDSSFRFSYEVTRSPDCSVTVSHLEYERLADVEFKGSLPQTDRDASDIFAQYVVPNLNARVAKSRANVEKLLNEGICRHKGQLFNPDIVPSVVETLVEGLASN